MQWGRLVLAAKSRPKSPMSPIPRAQLAQRTNLRRPQSWGTTHRRLWDAFGMQGRVSGMRRYFIQIRYLCDLSEAAASHPLCSTIFWLLLAPSPDPAPTSSRIIVTSPLVPRVVFGAWIW